MSNTSDKNLSAFIDALIETTRKWVDSNVVKYESVGGRLTKFDIDLGEAFGDGNSDLSGHPFWHIHGNASMMSNYRWAEPIDVAGADDLTVADRLNIQRLANLTTHIIPIQSPTTTVVHDGSGKSKLRFEWDQPFDDITAKRLYESWKPDPPLGESKFDTLIPKLTAPAPNSVNHIREFWSTVNDLRIRVSRGEDHYLEISGLSKSFAVAYMEYLKYDERKFNDQFADLAEVLELRMPTQKAFK